MARKFKQPDFSIGYTIIITLHNNDTNCFKILVIVPKLLCDAQSRAIFQSSTSI